MNTQALFHASCAVISYLCGGINGAIIMSKLFYHDDIRTKGSHNPGFTNFKRVYGLGLPTVLVFVLDILKAMIPVLLSAYLFERAFGLWQFGAAFSGIFCMLGHCFPVWYGFKGGKAFLTGFATIWFVDYRMALIATVIFLIVLIRFRYMSAASCASSISCPVSLFLLGGASTTVMILVTLGALLIIARHFDNFVKLRNGTEPKFTFFK